MARKPLLPPVTLESIAAMAADQGEVPSFPKSLPPEVNAGEYVPNDLADFAIKVITAYARNLSDALNIYTPLPAADAFHKSKHALRLVSGSNQAGKTLAAAVECARIARGMDPYEKREASNQLMLVLGKDENHLGQTIWQKMFFPGAFFMVPDEHDGFWRSVRPNPADPLHLDPIDEARRHLWQPASPLLPPAGMEIAYAKRNKGIPSQCTLSNGTQILFHTSRGSARQGIQLDYAWPDEEVVNERWIHELIGPRLVKKNGIAVWSATPEDQTPQFFELMKRAEQNDKHVALFMLQVADNPFYSDEAKEIMYENLKAQGDAVLQVKWYGKPAIRGLAIYPTYEQKTHGVVPFEIPDDWMRIAAVDPGTQFSAAVFIAIPPDKSAIHVYDELLCRNEDAAAFARKFKQKVAGHCFDTFLIDKRAGRRTTEGRSNTTFEHYAEAMAAAGVPESRQTGTQFMWGCDDPRARITSVNRRLTDGTLKFHIGRTVLIDEQIQRRYYAKDNPNKPAKQKGIDLVDAMEYGVAYFDQGIYYHEPARSRDTRTEYDVNVYEHFKTKHKRRSLAGSQWAF